MRFKSLCNIILPGIFALIFLTEKSYSSVNNVSANIYKRFTALQCDSLIKANLNNPNFVILDVRTPAEWNSYHVLGSINRSTGLTDFAAQLDALPKQKIFLLHCQSGGRSAGAFAKMKELGFAEVYEMISGINSWINAKLPTTTLVEPKLMLVSHSDIIKGNNSDTIKITVTNRANGSLTFNSMSVTDIHPVNNNFDSQIKLEGAQDYTFSVVHTPVYENDEETKIDLESNGGNLGVDLIFKNGTIITGEKLLSTEISVYPNPADKFLLINNPNGEPVNEFSLINIAGQSILQKSQISDFNRIDVSNLNIGIYILRLKTDHQSFSQKIIIKH